MTSRTTTKRSNTKSATSNLQREGKKAMTTKTNASKKAKSNRKPNAATSNVGGNLDASTTTEVLAQLVAIQAAFGTAPTPLTFAQRKSLHALLWNVKPQLVTQVLDLAESNGGMVLGLPLDVEQGRDAVTRVLNAQAIAKEADRIRQITTDDALSAYAGFARNVRGLSAALLRVAKTASGQQLASKADGIKAAGTPHRRAKARRSPSTKSVPPAVATPAPEATPSGAVVSSPTVAVAPGASNGIVNGASTTNGASHA